MWLPLVIALLPAFALCTPEQPGNIKDGKVSLHCKFVPKLTFFAIDDATYPVHECKSGESIHIWLTSEDLRSPKNAMEWIEEADIQLPVEAVQKEVLGKAYRHVKDSQNSAVAGLKLANPNVSIKGLKIIKSPYVPEAEVVPMPNVGFSDFFWGLLGYPKNKSPKA